MPASFVLCPTIYPRLRKASLLRRSDFTRSPDSSSSQKWQICNTKASEADSTSGRNHNNTQNPSPAEPGTTPLNFVRDFNISCSETPVIQRALRAAASIAMVATQTMTPILSYPALAETAPVTMNESQVLSLRRLFDDAFDLTNAGDFRSAEVIWTQIINTIPERPEGWSNRGNSRVSQNKLELAIEDFNKAIEIDPSAEDPYLNRGVAHEGLGHFAEAIADYNTALLIDDKDPVAYNNRGNAEGGMQEWDKAIRDYAYASAISKNFVFARANLALAMYQVGQTKQAMGLMRSLALKYSNFPDMHAALAVALFEDGRGKEALEQWEIATEQDPRYRDLQWVHTIRRWPPKVYSGLEKLVATYGTW